MARADNAWSRWVALLKIVLPLIALALLSSIFLLSRTIDPTATIPFTEVDVEDRVREPRLTEPKFSGDSLQSLSRHSSLIRSKVQPANAVRVIKLVRFGAAPDNTYRSGSASTQMLGVLRDRARARDPPQLQSVIVVPAD